MKESCKVAIKHRGGGKYAIAVAIDNAKLKKSKNGSLYEFVHFHGPSPIEFDVGNEKIRPQVLFKVFKKLTPSQVRAIEYRRVLNLAKFPIKQIL